MLACLGCMMHFATVSAFCLKPCAFIPVLTMGQHQAALHGLHAGDRPLDMQGCIGLALDNARFRTVNVKYRCMNLEGQLGASPLARKAPYHGSPYEAQDVMYDASGQAHAPVYAQSWQDSAALCSD